MFSTRTAEIPAPLSLASDPPFYMGADQGPLSPRHVSVTAPFIQETFMQDSAFSLNKAEAFLRGLEEKRATYALHARETAKIERIQRDVWTFRQANEDGDRQGVFGRNAVLRGYDAYVLPQAQRVVDLIRAGSPAPAVQAAAQDFVRGYAPFFAPNTKRTAWTNDSSLALLLQRIFLAPTFKKDEPRALEASNLAADSHNREEISACLRQDLPVGHYMSPDELRLLKERGFDISLISPGVSAFWRRTTVAEVEAKRARYTPMFPRPDEKVTYDGPRYRSDYSTKFSGAYWRDGKKYKVKIKLGLEVHPDFIVGRLREYMGYSADQMQHREEIKVHLGDKSYDQFERELGLKYGVIESSGNAWRRGEEPDTGERYVVFKDVLIELRPEDEIRVSICDVGSYDGTNRREWRSKDLLSACLGTVDGPPRNYRVVLVKPPQGQWHVEYRYQDLGGSLGSVAVIRRPRDLLLFPTVRNKIEEYDRTFLKKNTRGDVTLIYNELYRRKRDVRYTTYNDLKWCARIFASLSEEVISRVLEDVHLPADLMAIYMFHLGSVRNQVIGAFDLDANSANILGLPPIVKTQLPRQKDINVGDAVKNGQIVGTYYPGKYICPKLQTAWLLFFNRLLGLATSLEAPSFSKQVTDIYSTAIPNRLVGNSHTVTDTFLEDSISPDLGKFSLSPGIMVSVRRSIGGNRQLFSAEGKGNLFVVTDELSFGIGVDSPFFATALRLLPLDVRATVQVLQWSVQHVFYADSCLGGLMTAPRIHKAVVGDIDRFALLTLKPNEVLRNTWSYGLSAGLSVDMTAKVPYIGTRVPFCNTGVGASVGWVANNDLTFYKNVWGGLHLVRESGNHTFGGISAHLMNAELVLLNAPLLGARKGRSKLTQEYWEIEITPPHYDQERASQALTANVDVEALVSQIKRVHHHPELISDEAEAASLPENFHLRVYSNATQSSRAEGGAALFFFNYHRRDEWAEVSVESEEDKHEFVQVTRSKSAFTGYDMQIYYTNNVAMPQGTSKTIALEMDRDNPHNFVAMIDVYDYHLRMKHSEVLALIARLNRRYAKDAETPFFKSDIPHVDTPYRKVYANGRIYVNGGKLLGLVTRLSPEALEAVIRDAYLSDATHDHASRVPQSLERADRKRICRGVLSSGKAVAAAAAKLTLLQDGDTSANTPARKQAQDHLATVAGRFVYALYQSKYGARLLKQVLGEDGLLVQAEIFGIYQQTGMLSNDMWQNDMRYCGESWGRLSKPAPISQWVRYEQKMPRNVFAPPKVPMATFVGKPVSNRPGNVVGLGQR